MAYTLIVNPGSTSRKYALYSGASCVVSLLYEETGTGFLLSVTRNGVSEVQNDISATDFENAIGHAVVQLIEFGDLQTKTEITKIGVRVVAAGRYFLKHRIIDDTYIQKLEATQQTAPLHTPAILAQIHACRRELPQAICVGVSDSAFHSTVPEHVRTISIAKVDAEQCDIQRFGYHGLSCASIARKMETTFGTVPARTIVCHVGGGVSITALQDGKSVSTSMGYSPASGMIMGSRGGDVTAGVLATLIQKKKLTGDAIYDYLYRQSGFQGVAGVRDLRLVLDRAEKGDADAELALAMFAHQARSWIAAHITQMGGLDAIVMTATASERNPYVRTLLLNNLSLFGIALDPDKNEACIGCEDCVHAENSSVKIAVLKTDESGEIARVVEETV